jgi:UDP-glucose 4-epimerase
VKSLGYLAGVKEESTFEAFNVGTGNGTSVLELIHSFENANVIKLNYDIGPRRPGDAESIYANCDKAKDQLGWETSLTLEDALRDAWNWQKRLSNNK